MLYLVKYNDVYDHLSFGDPLLRSKDDGDMLSYETQKWCA